MNTKQGSYFDVDTSKYVIQKHIDKDIFYAIEISEWQLAEQYEISEIDVTSERISQINCIVLNYDTMSNSFSNTSKNVVVNRKELTPVTLVATGAGL